MKKSLLKRGADQLGQMLLQVRKEAGLTQSEVAARLCRPQSFVAKYEAGERQLSVVEFLFVADALETDGIQILRKLRLNVRAAVKS